ncbi:hypothetical protein ASC78_08245 [Variovorax sp. Root318D1]|uniref:P-loop ATPase, Sll1717 family n=1 Tax=Variovorax sp. Root318D1 TaxID=1736513 RepID=UPI000701D036|nr:hypothetical protein [Variovorax sp. Root318D1]KQU85333.1 hypothetical protein ASC78_08245 [Variovorax sp. Root318D1]
MKFNETEIAQIFGHEAAEDEDLDRLRAYYFKSNVFDQVANDLPLRVLVGHKGIGKSALFHVAIAEEQNAGKLSILVKPDDIAGIGDKEEDFLKLIREWKVGIIEIIAKKAISSFGLPYDGWRENLNSYGGKFIEFLQSTFKTEKYLNLSAAKKGIVEQFLKNGRIYVYLDDLDRGWEGQKKDIRKISALINAIRDISSDSKGVSFRVSLRSDVYYLVRTSDESTDKIEGSVVWHSWTNHEILAMLAKRVEQYFGRTHDAETLIRSNQKDLAKMLDPVMMPIFEGKGNWAGIPTHRMLMSLIRKRPRDLVKLCTLAARKAAEKKDERISTEHFNAIFEEYSQGRLQDTINEYRSELPEVERLLFGMKPSRKDKKAITSYSYTTEALLKKIENVMQSGTFRFAGGKIAERKALAAFMYKINFLTARKEIGKFIDRRYFEESRYLSHQFADFGFDWEMHPAYRWALQPENLSDVFAQMNPSIE